MVTLNVYFTELSTQTSKYLYYINLKFSSELLLPYRYNKKYISFTIFYIQNCWNCKANEKECTVVYFKEVHLRIINEDDFIHPF